VDDATDTQSFTKGYNVLLGTVSNLEIQHQKFDTYNTLVSQAQSINPSTVKSLQSIK